MRPGDDMSSVKLSTGVLSMNGHGLKHIGKIFMQFASNITTVNHYFSLFYLEQTQSVRFLSFSLHRDGVNLGNNFPVNSTVYRSRWLGIFEGGGGGGGD